MHKSVFLILCSILLSSATVFAKQLTPDASLSRLRSNAHKVRGLNSNLQQMRLVYTAKVEDKNCFYVFRNTSDGESIIAGADDLMPAIMAYGINNFDADKMPIQLQEWLSYYKQLGHAVITSGQALNPTALDGQAIAPLIKTKWDQGEPYDKDVVSNLGEEVPVGCVATAMAQIMYFWKHPLRGTGTHSYTAPNGKGLFVNFGATTYEWNNMLPTYGTYAIDGEQVTGYQEYNETQAQAVSTLMYHCGVSCDMSYGANGSGAYAYDACASLIKHFGYDKGIKLSRREFYTDEQWVTLLCDELAQGRPMMYCGATRNNEGHCFICDGHDGKGYFHFNWGWSGYGDGYYMVTGSDPLHPHYHGIGGSLSSSAYDQYQELYTGIQPAKAGSRREVVMVASRTKESSQGLVPALITNSKHEEANSVTRGSSYFIEGAFINSSVGAVNVIVGAIVRNTATGQEYTCTSQGGVVEIKSGSGYNYYSVSFDAVPENGTFEVYPAYLPLGDNGMPLSGWSKMPLVLGSNPFKVKISGTAPSLLVTDIQLSKQDGFVTENPTLSVTMKAQARVSKMRLSANVYDWNGSTALNFYTISTSLTMNQGEEKTLSDIKLSKSVPFESGKAYRIEISSRTYEYALGNQECTQYFFFVGNEDADAIQLIPADPAASTSDFGIFNLQGQPVAHPTRGIYIQDGRKVLR